MRLVPALLTGVLFPAIAGAANGDGEPLPVAADPDPTAIIGGKSAKAGTWPDVVAVLYPTGAGHEARCTGTLVAPTVVLTAAHCYDALSPTLPDSVLIGASSLARPNEGETIAIAEGFVFPNAETSLDVAVLVLERRSTRAARPIATGWARADILNGAAVSLVGFGAINRNGDQFIDELQEARSTITDFDCSRSLGCNEAARPAGELGAGGMGIDTCPGDSGGPLYLVTSYGILLAGVTSRSYDDASFACSDGGIYGRPDKIIDWIEATAGVAVTHGPEPAAEPIVAPRGDGGNTRIAINDPSDGTHRFEIATPPAHGTAKVRSDGWVRVCTNPEAPIGDDQLTVTITDTKRAGRAVAVTINVQIVDGAPGPACDLDDLDVGGCCNTRGRGGGAIPLAIGVLALAIRRRRCATLPPWPRPG